MLTPGFLLWQAEPLGLTLIRLWRVMGRNHSRGLLWPPHHPLLAKDNSKALLFKLKKTKKRGKRSRRVLGFSWRGTEVL